MFCGDKCLQEARNSYHCWECKQGTSIFKCIGIAHLALRLTIETSQANSNNDQIYNLLTHINDLNSLELYHYSLVYIFYIFSLYIVEKCNIFLILIIWGRLIVILFMILIIYFNIMTLK